MQVHSGDNEIKAYLDGRYLSPPEALWHIFEFPMHQEFPTVSRLQVHMPREQQVYFNDDTTPDELRNRMEAATTNLLEFFRYNAQHADGRQYLYSEFPQHFVYRDKKWRPRKNLKGAIGRMYQSNPAQGERFYLRLLLTVQRGPTSYEDLRTVHGVLQPSFRAACTALGLLRHDREWWISFEEIAVFASGYRLRGLFVFTLLHGAVGDPRKLWDDFKDAICDDLPHAITRFERPGLDFPDSHHDYGRFLIACDLEDLGRSLAEFNLEPPQGPWAEFDRDPSADRPAIDPEAAAELCRQLNDDQRHAFDRIVAAVADDSPSHHFFLQGAGGTGKTFLYRAIYGHLQGKSVLCVASSGIAATLLPNGRTAHSQFKIPLDLDDSSGCGVTRESPLGRRLRNVDLLIWDEVTMQNRFAFEAVHRLLCDMRSSDELFGGVPVVLGGDWAQTLPVVVRGNRASVLAACLRRSFIWRELEVLTLRQNMRLQAGGVNAEFATWLTSLSRDLDMNGPIKLPEYLRRVTTAADLCEAVFPRAELRNPNRDPDFFASRAILAVRNDQLPPHNDMLMDELPGELKTYYADEEALTETGEPAPEVTREFLQSLQIPGLPPSFLKLKVGAPVMLLRNFRPNALCNGTRLVVTRLYRYAIEGGSWLAITRVRCISFHGSLSHPSRADSRGL